MKLVLTAHQTGSRTPNWLKVLTLAVGIAGVLGLVTQGFSASSPAVSDNPNVVTLPAQAGAVPLPGDGAAGLSGTVTDADTGRPLPAVEVRLFDALGSPAGTGFSDSAGRYRVDGLPAGAYYARTSNALGYVNQLLGETGPCFGCDTRDGVPVWMADGDTVGGVDFALRRGGGVSGTVTDAATGTPLERVTIVFFTPSMKAAATAVTGAGGHYSLGEGLPAGIYLVKAINDQGYADETYADPSCAECQALPSGMGVPIIIGETTAGIDFALKAGGRIAGLVSSGIDGVPLPGVDVVVLASDGTPAARGRTDSRGRYLTEGGLSAGTYFVRTANRSGYLDGLFAGTACPYGQCQVARDGAAVTVDGATTTEGIDFALLPGGRFAGTVVDGISNSALPGVEVLVFDQAGTLIETVVSDLSGRFITGTGLPSGAYGAKTSNRFGYRDELYRDIPCPDGFCEVGKGLLIVVSAGATTNGIDFRLENVQTAADVVSTAICTLPANYVAGTAFTVTIVVTPVAGVFVQAIEDAPPTGWTATTISGGGAWDAVNGKVKWGPFFDDTVRTLTYVVTPPAGSAGLKTFAGLASFDGADVAIGGARTISSPAVTPVITWAAPASIAYGTALGGTQLNATTTVAGTFAYTPAAGAVLAVGTRTLSVTFTPTDTVGYTTATKDVSLEVTKATPVITWAAPAPIVYGTALGATQLNATASVAGTFGYNPLPGSTLPVGTHTLSVTFAPFDLANYTTATKDVSIEVTQATPVITWATPAGIPQGTALGATQLNATASVAGSFVYTPAAGTVLAVGVQTLSVTFTPTDTANYTTATKDVTIEVGKATPVITWAAPASITYGTALGGTQLNATTSVAGTFAYTPAAGTVLAAGTAQTLSVTFTPTDTASYTTATKDVTIDVTKATPVITWATPTPIVYGTALGGTQLNATTSVAGTFVYTPAAGAVPGAGTQTLSTTFTPTDTANYATATKDVTISVTKATPVITWAAPASVGYGTALGGAQLNATANVAGTFAYSPAAGAVPGAGTQTLSTTFTPTDTANYTTATKDVTIEVTKATPVITWATPAGIPQGTALGATQLNATTSVAGTFAYTPAAGTVLPVGAHTLSVTFTPTDTANYTTAAKDVTIEVGKATPVITWPAPAPITQGTALSDTQLNATASVAGTFAYTPAAGTVLPVGTQTLSVTFTPTDTASYTTATKDVTIEVTKKIPVITWAPPASIVYGTALSGTQLNATASVAGTFVYAPAAGAVPGAGTQTLSVTFTPTDSANYTTATKDVTIEVTKAAPVITWATPASIGYGTALGGTQLNATANVAGTMLYTPAAGAVLAMGTHTLSVTFTPTDAANYTTATKDVTIDVTKATPVITWPAPASIVYGTALSGTQLNATAIVAGTFVYTPVAGTVLPAGTHTLSVTFTPADSANYTTATKDVTASVAKATPVITWPTPAPIVHGEKLTTVQLNATASVAGTFVYTPAEGTEPALGTQILSVTFTPTDAANYSTTGATVSLRVLPNAADFVGPQNGGGWSGQIVNGQLVYREVTYPILNGKVIFPDCMEWVVAPNGALFGGVLLANCTPGVGTTPVVTWATPGSIVWGTALGGAQLKATASVPGTFVYTPPAGTVLSAGTQPLTALFTPTDGTTYTTATATVNLVVTKVTPVVTWPTPAAIVYGIALSGAQLNATASVAGTIVYTPAEGTVPAAGTRTLTATFTPADTVNYANATATVSLVVTKAAPVVTWAAPAAIANGTALTGTQLNAAANIAGTFVYSPAAGAVLPIGTHTLSTTFTPTDTANYALATGTVSLVVEGVPGAFVGPKSGGGWSGQIVNGQLVYRGVAYPLVNGTVTFPDCLKYIVAPNGMLFGGSPAPNCAPGVGTTPVITWPTPVGITVGTALSTTQLNATASVAGTFVYTPPAGTMLDQGTHTLTASFTPTDTANYATATATVTLAVYPAVGSFMGPQNGGGWSGQIVGGQFVYRGMVYPLQNGTVIFPDCMRWLVAPNGMLFGGARIANCTPGLGTTPEVTWAAPAAVTQGTALSGTQLNATANVPGTFAYTPAAGAVLPVGTHTLTALFTPTDRATYTTAVASVTLVVNAGVGSGFIGPHSGGGWSGQIVNGQFVYRGQTYPLVNGTVIFPDCMQYIVAPTGALFGGTRVANCTPVTISPAE